MAPLGTDSKAGVANASANGVHYSSGLNIVPASKLDLVSSTEYDYIIVGGGAGGCPLAAALAEEKSLRVLLLERGATRDQYPETKTIDGWYDLPSTDALQLTRTKDGVVFARANVLSGGTAVNIGVWGHASAAHIKEEGWDADAMRSAYEHLDARLSHPGLEGPFQDKMLEAFTEIGIKPNNGVTPEHLIGAKTIMRTWDKNNVRHPADELLVGVENVDIVTQALVSKIRFSGSDGTLRAVGVDFTSADGIPRSADVSPSGGEVILAAGTMGTPQLLMLSGIGPETELEKLGLTPRVSLPVGRNLADCPLNGIGIQTREAPERDVISVAGIQEDRIFFVSTGNGEPGTTKWGLMPMVTPGLRTNETMKTTAAAIGALPEELRAEMGRSMGVFFKLYRVKTRGAITLDSTDPAATPSIDYPYFTDPADVASGIEGIRTLKALLASKPVSELKVDTVPQFLLKLAPALAAFPPGQYPGALPLLPDPNDASEAATWLRNTVCTCWHMHGTCRVGEVVDDEHRVKGVEKLRVMDASVLRDVPGTNPMATIMALGRVLGLKMLKERVELA
ncbi:GMC oxidoreductase family [Klebsormidium nitens]|uniref:GMC oxidoreductase family n=1 Tax=Klebsormidium nitens TaxID=105231 RepID=A0A1Y1HII6_KLENI|nr:GMC oxidoreductase family [Klebsormidium nitens]|eukprot:GAQ78305.1 GMC oxidoreductase family [Klebsormidium nitens]